MRSVGFTGTKDGLTTKQLDSLYKLLETLYEADHTTMHNGDCVGADESAYTAFKSLGGVVIGHIPTRSIHRAFCKFDDELEPRHYLTRNKTIVDMSDIMIACPNSNFEKRRSGTWHTVRCAQKRKKPLCIIWPSGVVTKSVNQ